MTEACEKCKVDYTNTTLTITKTTLGAVIKGEMAVDGKYIGWFVFRYGGKKEELQFLTEMEKRWNAANSMLAEAKPTE